MKQRVLVVLGCLSAISFSLAHAEVLRPIGTSLVSSDDDSYEHVLPVHALYPVDPSGGPRGPRAQLRSMNAQLTTEPLPTWTFQIGNSATEQATATAVCKDFVYTVGRVNGRLLGQSHAGGMDVFLIKQSIKDGSLAWVEQFGSPMDDYATGVTVYGCATGGTSVYVTGYTNGTLPGAVHTGVNRGGYDIFLRKYDGDKNLKWSRQSGSDKDDLSYGVSVNDKTGDVYLTGYTLGSFVPGVVASSNDVLVARYLADGSLANAIQFGSSSGKSDIARGVAVDRNGKVYAAGYTNGVFPSQVGVGGQDMFLVKFSADLSVREWIRQQGTPGSDFGYGVAASRNASGDVEIYAVGQTSGNLLDGGALGHANLTNAGDYDAVVFQYSDSGVKKRATLLGTKGRDSVSSIASDGGANVYVVGTTTYDLKANPNATVGSVDVFLAKFDVKLMLKSVHQYDSKGATPLEQDDTATGVFADKGNGVYVVGHTTGNIGNVSNPGGYDLFVMRYADGCAVDSSLETVCRSATGCGDPHLWTADRYYYDFQSVGEFVLTESLPQATQQMVVQVRQKAWGGTVVAVYSAVAARFGTQRVGIYARATDPLIVDGHAVSLAVDDVLPLEDGTRVVRLSSTRYVIASPAGDRLVVENYINNLDLTLTLSPVRAGQVRGLLGNFNNIREDDFALRSGAPLAPPLSFEKLYKDNPNFADSWRITQSESLFDYGAGESTATFTSLNLPSHPVSIVNLTPAQKQNAQAICQAAGVNDATHLEGCVLDVGLTNEPNFAIGAAASQAQQPPAKQVYQASFENEPGSEWSTVVTSVSPSGDRVFLGEFGNESVQLALSGLPAHNQLIVTFNLFVLQGWDGNGPFGPNYFGIKADGEEVYRTTFSNTWSSQFYPDTINGSLHPARLGAAKSDTLFYPDGDSIYEMSIVFEHSSQAVALQFFAEGLPGITNETWGIDKVRIETK